MTDLHLLWHKVIYGIAFCLFGGGSVWLAFQIGSGRLVSGRQRSFVIGALTGLTAATMYVCIWLAVNAFRLLIENGYANLGELMQVLIAFSLNAFLFGLLPAAFTGGVTGVLIGYSLMHRKGPLSSQRAAVIGLGVCLGVTLLWHLALALFSFYLSDDGNPFAFASLFYVLFIGLPSLIYMTVGARMSSVAGRYLTTR